MPPIATIEQIARAVTAGRITLEQASQAAIARLGSSGAAVHFERLSNGLTGYYIYGSGLRGAV